MKINIKRLSAALLTACSVITVLSSCGEKAEDSTTLPTESTAPESTQTQTVLNDKGEMIEVATVNENYTIYLPPTTTKPPVVPYTYAIPSSKSEKVEYTYHISNGNNNEKNGQTEIKTEKVVNDIVEEKSKGISVVTKSPSIYKGNGATVMIQGKPGKIYSIDFYENLTDKADYKGLENKKADSNGLVTWTFVIEDSCSKGARKIYIKDTTSSDFVQTSICVN